MMTNPPKKGDTTDVYFEKAHHWISNGDVFSDRTMYKDTQPEKKKGFSSGDYKRRDEFSNSTRTEQYREQLIGEQKYGKTKNDTLEEDLALLNTTTLLDKPKPMLFDLLFGKDDNTVDGSSKVARDTKNPTQLSVARDLGTYRTTTTMAHAPPENFEKPQFARKPVVRDTFFRKTNVFW